MKDNDGQPFQLISAVCGQHYTLYLLSSPSSKNNQLAYAHKDHKSGSPVFVSINGRNPIHLFGGGFTAAAVDTEGSIFFITGGDMEAGKETFEESVLPLNEKPVSIACGQQLVFVSSSSGRVFRALVPFYGELCGKATFEVQKELEGIEIIEVSGIDSHFLAVCKDGRVFVYGSNLLGEAGLGEGRELESGFTEITGLKYKIISASAGSFISLFITSEGKVLACGHNRYGQLLTTKPSSEVYTPIETTISGGASFCIAGFNVSFVFVGTEPPPNTPNRRIIENVRNETSLKVTDTSKDEVLLLKAKISSLEEEIEKLRHQQSVCKNCFCILDQSTMLNLKVTHELGFGGMGKVSEVVKEDKYALKEMNLKNASVSHLRQFIGEYEKLSMLDHPNIVRTFGIYLSDEERPPSILLELCACDLQELVRSGKQSKKLIALMTYEIAVAMRYVHKSGLIHRDLKPSNILIGNDGHICISDFGIATLLSAEDQNMTSIGGTQKFMAPELLREEKYDEKVDVYSFGVLLFFIASGGEMPRISIIDI